ncbi:uncharacterized protein DS421_16g530220 [Arachis hypogaea]|nr:uncharacterized protein DS421_16g530220 [Arachis hypogaea]
MGVACCVTWLWCQGEWDSDPPSSSQETHGPSPGYWDDDGEGLGPSEMACFTDRPLWI